MVGHRLHWVVAIWHLARCTATCAPGQCVTYNGHVYRTLDGTHPDSTTRGCQGDYLSMLNGWSLSGYTADSRHVGSSYAWGTDVVVHSTTSGEYSSTTLYRDNPGNAWRVVVSGSSYKPSQCSIRILISKRITTTATTTTTSTFTTTTVVSTTSTSSTSTSFVTTSSLLGTVPDPDVCRLKDAVLCPVPPGTWLVRGQPCIVTSTEAEPQVLINTTLCPPSRRTFSEMEVVDVFTLDPIWPNAPQLVDRSRATVSCACVSPREGSVEGSIEVPTLAPQDGARGTRNFTSTVRLCSDSSCDQHVEVAAPNQSSFNFEVISPDKDRLEVRSLVTCPSANASDLQCLTLVREKCVPKNWTWLGLSFRRGSGGEAHRLFWNMSSIAWLHSRQMHLFLNVRRCDTNNATLLARCGRCLPGSSDDQTTATTTTTTTATAIAAAAPGGGRRLQVQAQGETHAQAQAQAQAQELQFESSGDEAVIFVPLPPGSDSRTRLMHQVDIEVPLAARAIGAGISAAGLLEAALAGVRTTWSGAQVTGLAFAGRFEEGQQSKGVLRVTLDIPAEESGRQWDPSALRQALAQLGLSLAPATAADADTGSSGESESESEEGNDHNSRGGDRDSDTDRDKENAVVWLTAAVAVLCCCCISASCLVGVLVISRGHGQGEGCWQWRCSRSHSANSSTHSEQPCEEEEEEEAKTIHI